MRESILHMNKETNNKTLQMIDNGCNCIMRREVKYRTEKRHLMIKYNTTGPFASRSNAINDVFIRMRLYNKLK